MLLTRVYVEFRRIWAPGGKVRVRWPESSPCLQRDGAHNNSLKSVRIRMTLAPTQPQCRQRLSRCVDPTTLEGTQAWSHSHFLTPRFPPSVHLLVAAGVALAVLQPRYPGVAAGCARPFPQTADPGGASTFSSPLISGTWSPQTREHGHCELDHYRSVIMSRAGTPPASVRSVMKTLDGDLASRLGSRWLAPTSLQRVQHCLVLLEQLARDNPSVSGHVHLSGYGENGEVFLIPIREDPAVLSSGARRGLGQVYRFVESAGSMANSAALLMRNMHVPKTAESTAETPQKGNINSASGANPVASEKQVTASASAAPREEGGCVPGENVVLPREGLSSGAALTARAGGLAVRSTRNADPDDLTVSGGSDEAQDQALPDAAKATNEVDNDDAPGSDAVTPPVAAATAVIQLSACPKIAGPQERVVGEPGMGLP